MVRRDGACRASRGRASRAPKPRGAGDAREVVRRVVAIRAGGAGRGAAGTPRAGGAVGTAGGSGLARSRAVLAGGAGCGHAGISAAERRPTQQRSTVSHLRAALKRARTLSCCSCALTSILVCLFAANTVHAHTSNKERECEVCAPRCSAAARRVLSAFSADMVGSPTGRLHCCTWPALPTHSHCRR